ncbi:MAG: PEPxxWA-CTERM sorting domain-containing protein [Sphingomonas sp.]|nr:PEPxxWA-CTERM sorting domain-containing protein [Sphingomonas sp.]
MKRFALLALASGMAIAAASPANAALVLAYSVNGGAITQLATDAGTPGSVSFAGGAGGYTFNSGAFSFPITGQYDLLTQTINVQSSGAAATLNIFVTNTNLPTLTAGTLMSSFTSNTLNNATATISSFYSTTNALYGGTLLRTAAFPAPGTFSNGDVVSAASPFSVTTRYDIAFGAGAGNFNGTANITAVPEPASWALMIGGFGIVGAALRRRQSIKASIKFA